jgi:glycosyltransferase involved in cell wall biosynthesis
MNSKYNRVMFVTNSLSGGGAERATNILVNAMLDSGNQVSLVAINQGPRDLIEPKCQIFELKRRWQGGLLSVLVAYFKLQRSIWKWKPEYLILNCDIPELLGALTIGRHKLITVEHATFPWINRIRLGKLIRKLLSARNTKWVAVSDHLSIWGLNSLPDISICNATIAYPTGRMVSNGKIKRLNFVGRLSKEKQPVWALDIAKQTNLPIRIYGEGLLKPQLQEYAKEHKVEIEFAGFVSNPWIFFSEGDLLLVPSSFEGDGLVVVEAISNRIPLIANNIPDLNRFKLESINYASSTEDFSRVILENLNNIEELVPIDSKAAEILKGRDPTTVSQKWNTFLTSLT